MSKRKLLLADDSVTIQKVINLTFADEDIEIITTDNGDAAMRKFIENSPDLVMIDVNMPGLSGLDICEMIKQDDATKHVPVVLLVGAFEQFDEAKARQSGADDFLSKPFPSIRQLVETVSKLLERKIADDEKPVRSKEAVAPLNGFEDVFENEAEDEYDSTDASIENLGEFVGSDDQMIQTLPNVDSPKPVINKFESYPITGNQPVYESFAENKSEDFSQKSDENTIVRDKERVFTEKENKNIDEIDEDTEPQLILNSDKAKLRQFSHSSADIFEVEASESNKIPIESVDFTKNSESFSPEVIEAIAEKVAEKISNKLIKKIVRETIEQMERE